MLFALTNAANAMSEDQCFTKWSGERVRMQPGPDATIDLRTGRVLSQTDGAKRTRALKLQALKDALMLRGHEDPKWLSYRQDCMKQ
jgi:hypothetical protein